MPVFTHVLVLREGRVVACGPRKTALTSAVLSRAFQTPIGLQRHRSRYTLKLLPNPSALL
jgi:iron complex transport system ATP-binding protein